ncbi:MAG TPA: energy transducer TonB [Thermoanaerobaculaceae bacterium]|nr:energy transducer TonB [Thermoanaerobaculaceae bacterium]
MFGLPDDAPPQQLEPEDAAPSRLFRLIEGEAEELPWPLGRDPKVLFLLDERISPRPIRLRDRSLILALAASLLLHLAIFSQLRADSLIQSLLASQRAQVLARKAPDDKTPFYEFVQLPKQRAEKPSQPKSPASDLDRRAHGGVGAPDVTPGSHGNTPELRIEPEHRGGPSRQASPPTGEREAARDPGRTEGQSGQQDLGIKPTDTGAGAVLIVPKESGASQRRSIGLKGLGAYGTLGSSGGALPDRKGGEVDVGPLAFDTEWYDWGPYAAEMLRRIKYHWDIPEIAQMGVPGVVRIHFFIERDGRVTGLEIQRESGRPPMDFAARDAILNASPLPPLPDDLGGVFHEGVTITFYYNTKVPETNDRG